MYFYYNVRFAKVSIYFNIDEQRPLILATK